MTTNPFNVIEGNGFVTEVANVISNRPWII
jgi:hypothetical protein